MLTCSLKTLTIAALLGFAVAAPTDSSVRVIVKNNCNHSIEVGQLANDESRGESSHIAQGASKTYTVDGSWQGRFWGRETCHNDCDIAGTPNPASLAEFAFKNYNGFDYYDVSFVDGYNLPMKIDPINLADAPGADKDHCGSPACAVLPECPKELQHYIDGEYIGCKSACSQFGNDEYCCLGSYNTVASCPLNSYAKKVKDVCPTVYTYPYDETTSTFVCKAEGYTVTFCPA